MHTNGFFIVATEAQRLIMVDEMFGQFSDGQWENSPGEGWKDWADCEVIVGDNVGRSFHVRKDNYNLTVKSLLDVVGNRMIENVRTKTGNAEYSRGDLMSDLNYLKQIMRQHTALTAEQRDRLVAIQTEEARKEHEARAAAEARAVRINQLAKEKGFSMYASYKGRTEVSNTVLLELLERY